MYYVAGWESVYICEGIFRYVRTKKRVVKTVQRVQTETEQQSGGIQYYTALSPDDDIERSHNNEENIRMSIIQITLMPLSH